MLNALYFNHKVVSHPTADCSRPQWGGTLLYGSPDHLAKSFPVKSYHDLFQEVSQLKTITLPLAPNSPAYLQAYLRQPEADAGTYPAIIIVPGGAYTHIPNSKQKTLP